MTENLRDYVEALDIFLYNNYKMHIRLDKEGTQHYIIVEKRNKGWQWALDIITKDSIIDTIKKTVQSEYR